MNGVRVLGILAALAAPAAVAAAKPDDVRAIILLATNERRHAEGRPRLHADARLAKAAQAFAQHMADKDTLDHRADRRDPGDRAKAAGYRWCRVAENIAYEFRSSGFAARELAALLVDDWMQSAGHRRNLLDPALADIGVGVAQSVKSRRWYAVQLFARKC